MSEQQKRSWPVLVTVVPYVLLGLLVAFTVVVKRDDRPSLLVDLALCALAALWMLVLFTLRPAWRDNTALMLVFFTGLMAIMAVLVVRDPWFGAFTPASATSTPSGSFRGRGCSLVWVWSRQSPVLRRPPRSTNPQPSASSGTSLSWP